MTKAILFWGSDSSRLGWFLRSGSSLTHMIHGPSICVSSGGGPVAALKLVAQSPASEILVDIPVHKKVDGSDCYECAEALENYRKGKI